MAIIKNKYKDKLDKQIKVFPNGEIPVDFTKKISYDNETVSNPNIIRSPKYGDDLNTTEFSKLVADLIYNDTVLNDESKKHNYLYGNGVIKNYKKEFEIYEKNLFKVLAEYKIVNFIENNNFSLAPPNSIAGNFSNNTFCNFYFYTNSSRLLNLYNFFYKEYNILGINTATTGTPQLSDDYSIITFNGEINSVTLMEGEYIGIVLYLQNSVANTTAYKNKNYLNYLKVGNGALKIGDIFVDIKKDTYIARSIINDTNLNQIKISDITETNFKDSFRTRRDILVAYYDQTTIMETMVFDGVVDLIIGDERINMYSPLDSQILTTPRIKKIEYLTVNNESFHRIHLDDLCLLKGINNNGKEILFRKVNQMFSIRNSIDNIFDGEYLIKNIDYINKTIDFVHPSYNGSFTQPQETENVIGYYGYLVPNIYVLYSLLMYKENGNISETQFMQADNVYDYVGLESNITRIEKTALQINQNNIFQVSNDKIKHLRNFNGNLLEYDDGQSVDVPSRNATGFTLTPKENSDYILNTSEQQLPNEYHEIGINSLTNSHFIMTEDNLSVINNSKIILSEIFLGVKNSLSSIGTEGIKIKIEKLSMLYALDDLRKITSIEAITGNNEFRVSLSRFDQNIRVNDILFISNNGSGNGDYQTVKIKRIENEKLIIDKINSTSSAEFKISTNPLKFPIYFNIIKYDETVKICESLLTNSEIKNQVINGLNGKFGDKNGFSRLKFDRFIESITLSDTLLKNGITISQATDFRLDVNTYYFISVAGFVINNIASVYSSILIEDHNSTTDSHFKKSLFNEINIRSFKGRYPNSFIISDEFGDINVYNINRTVAPFFRLPKYSIMAYDFSDLSISINDMPPSEDVILFDPLTGRFKFHPNVTPKRIYLSYYTSENLSGAAESESFIFKRGDDSNDTVKGKIQELENKYEYGANFKSPIMIDGIITDNSLNYKGPFYIKNNKLLLKNNSNFVDVDINKYEIEIDKKSSHEIIDLEKNSLFLRENVIERNNQVQSINRQFFDQLFDQEEKDYYEKPTLNNNEETILNISEDTTIDQNLLNVKKWQNVIKQENNVVIPFLTNKKFNKINFYDFKDNLVIDCTERTKIENIAVGDSNLSEILKETVYRKLNEKNYKYALKNDYTEDKTFSFKSNDETKQLNKTIVKDTQHFDKSEIVTVFAESELNSLIKSDVFEYTNLNINNTNIDNFIVINDHVINFDMKKINKKYANDIIFTDSIDFDETFPSLGLIEGKLYFFKTAGHNEVLDKNIEIGDFIVRGADNNWDFYRKNDIFNISKIIKSEDLSCSLNDFNENDISYAIDDFDNSFQKLFINNDIVKQKILKITENKFLISVILKNTSDEYNLYIQVFELSENNIFYPIIIDEDKTYKKIASSTLLSDLTKIDKNSIYYDYLVIDENRIILILMSLDGFIFKYLYLNDLSVEDGLVFINDKKIKNNPKSLKLNDEVFAIIFNSENSDNYDTNLGNLEIKLYEIETKKSLIFMYKESSKSYSEVDKIIIDNIKNQSDFNLLRLNDNNINIFYSNISAVYLNNLTKNINDEYTPDSPSGVLNCFKTVTFLKTEEAYLFDVSNKKTVYFQNIGQTAFTSTIYPFKINSNIFGVNYIESDIYGNETANRMFTYDSNGVLQKEYFENEEYSQQNPDFIKYIYSFNNRQALEFSDSKIRIFNFNNDYTQLILKQDIDYKKYFPLNNYATLFANKINNAIEIITVKDKNGDVFNKKILTYFTKANNKISINLALVNGVNIDFSEITSFEIVPPINGSSIIENDNQEIVFQKDILHVGNKIYLTYLFLIGNGDLSQNAIFIYLVEIGNKLQMSNQNFVVKNDIQLIFNLKNTDSNSFFFNKTMDNEIEIFSLRQKTIVSVTYNIFSKHTVRFNADDTIDFLELRTDGFNISDKTVDLDFEESILNITKIFKINLNDNVKYVAESLTVENNINKYNYFYVKSNLDLFSFFNLSVNSFNINYIDYNLNNNEILFLGDINNETVNYLFDFDTNLYITETIESVLNKKYNFVKIENTDKYCYLYYVISGSTLSVKIFNKKDTQLLNLVYEKTSNYVNTISNIIFNNYRNIYETFVYSTNNFTRTFWNVFPMNNIESYKNMLEFEIVNNKIDALKTRKNVFSGLSVAGVISYNSNFNKDNITFLDESLLYKINNNAIEGLTFYINSNNVLCVFSILNLLSDGSYEILFLLGQDQKASLQNKRIDYYQYIDGDFSFYKKSYQSLALKINMFNYNGLKKNEYEIYRKNNYYYDMDSIYENNTLYKSNVYILKEEYKKFQIIYKIDDEYEKTKIYVKSFLILKNNLYTINDKVELLTEKYVDTDKVSFVCERLSNSNIFISFKKNASYVYNFILNKNYGLEEIDSDFTKRELYKFLTIKDKQVTNILQQTGNYEITPFAVKKLFNNGVLFLLKVKNNNITKILHILYKENGIDIDYYNNNYLNSYVLPQSDEIIGYSIPTINSYGYTSLYAYKNDSSKDILQFGIDGEGGICKLKGVIDLF